MLTRGLALLVAAVAALLLAPGGAQAATAPIVGLADQHARSFAEPRMIDLGVRHGRRVVPWNYRYDTREKRNVEEWMRVARETAVIPLITFGPAPGRKALPTLQQFKREFAAFRKRFPEVREYSPWNEPNIARVKGLGDPRKIAAYYRAIRTGCPKCTVLGADLVDSSSMDDWLRSYLAALSGLRPRHWGLHNYVDAHTPSAWGTRTMLRLVPGEVWFTETGGIYRRGSGRSIPSSDRRSQMKTGPTRATAAFKRVFRLAALSPRVKRVYVYHYRAQAKARWDSALVSGSNTPRPNFRLFADALERGAAAAGETSGPLAGPPNIR